MCVPPHCTPARRALGCLSLRQASAAVVTVNAIYGLMLVVVHVFILTERARIKSSLPPAATPAPTATTRHGDNWFLQIIDLDIAWAHGCLGMGDWWLCMFGLVYGIVIMSCSAFVFHAALTSPKSAAVITRWYMMFMHVELILYVALVIVKLPLLCHMKNNFLVLMKEDCDVLRFMFFERAGARIILGSLCCWMFSSFSYYLAWGDPCVDDATMPDPVNVDENQRLEAFRGGRIPTSTALQTRVYPSDYSVNRASFRSPVGEPVSVTSQYAPRFIEAGTSSCAGATTRYPGSQYIMPRASSSIQSQQSEVSNSLAERQMLIKPPIVV